MSLAATSFAEVQRNGGQSLPTSAPGAIESQTVVFEDGHTDPYDRTNLYGFNHAPSVTQLGGNRVMCVWFSGPFEGSVHQVILGSVSEDGGQTWDEATVVNDAPHVSDFDPGFIHAGDRTLLFFSNGRWASLPSLGPSKGDNKQTGVESFHMLLRTSDDQGRTWVAPREVGAGPGWNCRSNGIKLSNGTLLIPTHHLQDPYTSSVLLSSDEGETWNRGPNINTPGKIGAAEPSVAELPDGTLIMVLRTRDGNLWLSRSANLGRNWSEPERQELPAAASSANVICTSNGKLVLTHNPTKPPLRTELTLRISEDGARTWSEPLVVAEVEPPTDEDAVWSRQVCYPSVCELSDQLLLIVWAHIELGRDHQTGIVCSARVRLN
jgi:predicted neuraminidase